MKREPSGSDMHLRQAFNTDLDAILQRCPSQGTVRVLRHRTVRGGARRESSQYKDRCGSMWPPAFHFLYATAALRVC